MHGHIDNKNQLWVPITVAGNQGRKEVTALIDTGFTGELLLPLHIAVPLGLKLAGASSCKLGDGSISKQMLFSASITWGTQTRDITVNVIDVEDALIGGGLLHGYVLTVDFQQKTLIVKEPGTDDPEVEFIENRP
ncbi:MAG: hypothetical protein HQL12_05800 [Candidatus Omnitrophica bacterium]|nr:hypothetical protein [Candidatus Omnitrophota bacterium]